MLIKWFWRDDNAVPAQYLLQPITSLLPHYRDPQNNEFRKKASSDWWMAFERMQVVLRMAADKVLDEQSARHKYHMSGKHCSYFAILKKASIFILFLMISSSIFLPCCWCSSSQIGLTRGWVLISL